MAEEEGPTGTGGSGLPGPHDKNVGRFTSRRNFLSDRIGGSARLKGNDIIEWLRSVDPITLFKFSHENTDVDLDGLAIHHTLGPAGYQAAPGNHTHESAAVALNVEDEGSLIVASPDTLNFEGTSVTVTESPTGTALVTIAGGAGQTIGAKISSPGSSQSISSAVSYSVVTMDTTDYNDGCTVSLANDSITIIEAGKYILIGQVGIDTTGSAGRRAAGISVNGTTVIKSETAQAVNANIPTFVPVGELDLDVGDEIKLTILQSSGSSANLSTATTPWLIVRKSDGIGPQGPSVADGDKGDITVSGSGTVWNIDASVITDTEVAAANKDGAAGTASMRTLGTGAAQAAAGNHTHSNPANVTDGDKGEITVTSGVWTIDADAVTNTKMANNSVGTAEIIDDNVTNAKIADNAVDTLQINALAVTDAKVAAANKDGAAGTVSMRTLGTGATQAAAGNHTHAGGDGWTTTVQAADFTTSSATYADIGLSLGTGLAVGTWLVEGWLMVQTATATVSPRFQLAYGTGCTAVAELWIPSTATAAVFSHARLTAQPVLGTGLPVVNVNYLAKFEALVIVTSTPLSAAFRVQGATETAATNVKFMAGSLIRSKQVV